MNKAEFIGRLSEKLDVTKKESEEIFNVFCSLIHDALVDGDEIRLNNIGSLSITETKARTCRNPKTGETIEVPAGRKVRFKTGKSMKEDLRA